MLFVQLLPVLATPTDKFPPKRGLPRRFPGWTLNPVLYLRFGVTSLDPCLLSI